MEVGGAGQDGGSSDEGQRRARALAIYQNCNVKLELSAHCR